MTLPCLAPGGEELTLTLSRVTLSNAFSQRASTAPLRDTLTLTLADITLTASHVWEGALGRSLFLPSTDLRVSLTRPLAYNEVPLTLTLTLTLTLNLALTLILT